MKSMAQRFADRFNEDQPEDLVIPFFTPKEGEPVIGVLLAMETVQNEKVKEPCQRYILETDTGSLSILMGAATDKQLAGKLNLGWLTYIEFQGKFTIDNGAKQVNRWKVQQVEYAPE